MGVIKKSGKAFAVITYPVWMPVSVFYKSFRRNTGQGKGVIKELYDSVKSVPEEQQLTIGLIEAVEQGELPDDQILKLPRQRFFMCLLLCIAQTVYLIWDIANHGRLPATLPQTAMLALCIAGTVLIYRISAKTQRFINTLYTRYKQADGRQLKAVYKIALWYRFFLSKKRTYQFGSLMFLMLSAFSFITGSLFWAIIPLIAAFCFFVPNIFSVQLRLWQLRARKLSVEEGGGISEFMKESNWLGDCVNPELFSRFIGALTHEA